MWFTLLMAMGSYKILNSGSYERPIFTLLFYPSKMIPNIGHQMAMPGKTIPHFKNNSFFSHMMASLHCFQELLTQSSGFR